MNRYSQKLGNMTHPLWNLLLQLSMMCSYQHTVLDWVALSCVCGREHREINVHTVLSELPAETQNIQTFNYACNRGMDLVVWLTYNAYQLPRSCAIRLNMARGLWMLNQEGCERKSLWIILRSCLSIHLEGFTKSIKTCEIRGSHGSKYDDVVLLGFDTM
jgi:hypothetical protein